MNKIIIGVVLVVVIIGGLFYFMQNQYKQPSQQQPIIQQPTIEQPTTQQPTAQQPQTNVEAKSITIQNFSFNPAVLTVKQGTKVTWTNQDSTTHTIKSGTFNSDSLNQGDTFDFTFNDTGSFDYSCGIHPSMTGKIIVE